MRENIGVKRAGDVLSAIFDERLMNKARSYSAFFAFWSEAVRKNGIATAADHSRIKELDRGILLVETDHPGWKQILQTKQSRLLNDFRRRFPELEISAISLMLSRDGDWTSETAAPPPDPSI
jgi:predicted nucleic acid-binding Zn ribbon protein